MAPSLARLACAWGASENVALCEESFESAVKGEPDGDRSDRAADRAGPVNCEETCRDEIIAAGQGSSSAMMDMMDDAANGKRGGGSSRADIIRGAGVSDCVPARLNCTELEDELWSRVNSLETALVASNRQIAKKEEEVDQQADLIREQQEEIGRLHREIEKKEKEHKRFLKNATAVCIEGRREAVDLREALEQANSVLQRVEREVAGGAGERQESAAPGTAGAGDGHVVGGGVGAKREPSPEQRQRERERAERERARVERDREAREREKHAPAGIHKRPPANHGDLLELERKLDEVNKRLKMARGGSRP